MIIRSFFLQNWYLRRHKLTTLISSETGEKMTENKTKPKPETEQKLSELQEEYLKERSIEAYQEMFSILHSYARSLILKKTKGKIFLSKDLVDNATLEASVRFMQQYEKPDFSIDASFAGLLNLKILESLYGPKIKRNDRIASLSHHVDDAHKKEIELGDIPETLKFKYMFRPEYYKEEMDPFHALLHKKENVIQGVMDIFDTIYLHETLKDYMLLNLAIILFFKKSKKYKRYRAYYLNKHLQEKLDSYIESIRNRLLEYS